MLRGRRRGRGVGAADVRPSVSIIKGVGRRDADSSNLKPTTCVGWGTDGTIAGRVTLFL